MRLVAKFDVPTKMLGNTNRMKWRIRQEANKKGVALSTQLEYCTLTCGGETTTVQVYTTGDRDEK